MAKPKPQNKPSSKKGKGKKKGKAKKPDPAVIRAKAQMEVGRLECEIIEAPWWRVAYKHWCRTRISRIKQIYKL